MKKILIFSFAYYPLVGGAEVAVKEITDRIKDVEFDMVTLWLDRKSPSFEKVGNVNVYRVGGFKSLYPVTAFWKAYTLHKKNNYDFIWSIMAAYAGFAGVFFKNAFPEVPFLLTLQEGDPESHILKRVGIFYPLWKDIFKKANYIQAISGYLAEFGKKHGATCKMEIVPNGVDLDNFKISVTENKFETNDLKTKSGIKDSDKVLITTSRLVVKNGVGDIIESLQYLPAHVKLLVLGNGPLDFNLNLKIKELKLESRVYLLGFKKHEETVKYLAISDIFIRPSLSEGLGNSFLEAMAMGLPIIGTNVGGIPDFLKDGETGLFCEVNNPKSIAEKVNLLLGNDTLRNKIIFNGKKLVQEKYEWGEISKRMREIFDGLFVK